jgi:hypothetical protein
VTRKTPKREFASPPGSRPPREAETRFSPYLVGLSDRAARRTSSGTFEPCQLSKKDAPVTAPADMAENAPGAFLFFGRVLRGAAMVVTWRSKERRRRPLAERSEVPSLGSCHGKDTRSLGNRTETPRPKGHDVIHITVDQLSRAKSHNPPAGGSIHFSSPRGLANSARLKCALVQNGTKSGSSASRDRFG